MKEMTNSTLDSKLSSLNLTAMRDVYQDLSEKIIKEKRNHIEYLEELAIAEMEYRYQKSVQQLLKYARLPRNKLLIDFDITLLPNLHPGLLKNLSTGEFIDRNENVLIFGNPGTGKSHLSIALAREWCLMGRKCLYITAANLVQELLVAKSKMALSNYIKRLDRFEVLIIDDISYIPYEKSESDVLFVLLAERYEQKSMVITSNLIFSNWGQIFKDEMTTNAAIDRLVHHATILELNGESYRIRTAKDNQQTLINNAPKQAAIKSSKKESNNVK
jgi:DNA replication protein DnaC